MLDEVTLDVNGFDLVQNAGAGDATISATLAASRFSGNLVIPSGAALALNRTNGILQNGTLTVASGATYRPTLSSTASYEKLQVSGAISLAGGLDLDVATLTASTGQSFTLLDNDGSDAVSGQSRDWRRVPSSMRAASDSRSPTVGAPGMMWW